MIHLTNLMKSNEHFQHDLIKKEKNNLDMNIDIKQHQTKL